MMGRLKVTKYQVGNGSKYFGGELWFNSQRIGLVFTVWTLGLALIWEFK